MSDLSDRVAALEEVQRRTLIVLCILAAAVMGLAGALFLT